MPSSTSSSSRLPLALLGAAALTVVIQLALPQVPGLWRFLYAYSNPKDDDGLRLESQFRLVDPKPGERLVILTGSSVTREGFDADAMSQSLASEGIRVLNLGTSGGQPLDMYLLAERYASLRPALIVHVGFVRCFFRTTYAYAKLPLSYNGYGLRELFKHIPRGDLWVQKAAFRDALLGRVFALYRFRDSVHGILLKQFPRALITGRRGQRFLLEASDTPIAPDELERQIQKARVEPFYKDSPYADMEKHFFRKYLAAVRAHGIPMVVMDAPVHPRQHELYPADLNPSYRHTVEQATAAAGVRYVPREVLPHFGAGDFRDFVHPISAGRARLSEFAVGVIREELAPGIGEEQ